MLSADFLAVGAVVIVMSFLERGREGTTAIPAPEEATKRKEEGLGFRAGLIVQDILCSVESLLGDNWFVLSLVILSVPDHEARTKGAG